MTKYIINSGGMRSNPAKTKEFFNEIVKDLGDNPQILMCFFAEKRENWEEKFTSYSEGFTSNVTVECKFELAIPEKFEEQIRNCDAIYIHGGDDHLVQYWLKQFDLMELFKDKVVATNSAGSDAIVASFWTCDWRQNMDGLGLVPIKFIPHFGSDFGDDDPRGQIDWEQARKELEEHGDTSLPIHALNEGEFIIFEQ